MKKIILPALFALLLLNSNLFSQESGQKKVLLNYDDSDYESVWKLAIRPSFGIKNGDIGEYVFLKDPIYSDDKLSYLDWNFSPEYYFSLGVDSGYKSFKFGLNLWTAIPTACGKIQDYDWFNNYSVYVTSTSGHDYLTNYSESDNYISHDAGFSVNAGWDFEIAKVLHINPFAAFEMSETKFKAKGMYASYGFKTSDESGDTYFYPYNDSDPSHVYNPSENSSTTVLSYKRDLYLVWVGLNLDYTLPQQWTLDRPLTIKAGFSASPYVYAFNEDYHPFALYGPTYFADICEGFFKAFKINAGLNYGITRKLSVNFDFSYFILNEIRGETYSRLATSKTWSHPTDSQGGADAEWFDISLGVKYTFF
jgi:hypothetical protein